jgi:hypothetical protein
MRDTRFVVLLCRVRALLPMASRSGAMLPPQITTATRRPASDGAYLGCCQRYRRRALDWIPVVAQTPAAIARS